MRENPNNYISKLKNREDKSLVLRVQKLLYSEILSKNWSFKKYILSLLAASNFISQLPKSETLQVQSICNRCTKKKSVRNCRGILDKNYFAVR